MNLHSKTNKLSERTNRGRIDRPSMDSGAFPPANSTIVGAISMLRIGLCKITQQRFNTYCQLFTNSRNKDQVRIFPSTVESLYNPSFSNTLFFETRDYLNEKSFFFPSRKLHFGLDFFIDFLNQFSFPFEVQKFVQSGKLGHLLR